jgi:hypothetical protein
LAISFDPWLRTCSGLIHRLGWKTMIEKINIKFGMEIKWNQTMRGELKKTIKKINETERYYNEKNWDDFLKKKKKFEN